jgi:hypothetical protein
VALYTVPWCQIVDKSWPDGAVSPLIIGPHSTQHRRNVDRRAIRMLEPLPWHRFDISKGIPVRRLHPQRVPAPRSLFLDGVPHRSAGTGCPNTAGVRPLRLAVGHVLAA